MKKIMISNGLRGKEHPMEYVDRCREVVKAYFAKPGRDHIELINTYFADYNGNRLQFLGRSISEGLALADIVVFMDDWHNYDGCRSEHFIATQYGVPILYLSTHE